jgi:hypothetical protein
MKAETNTNTAGGDGVLIIDKDNAVPVSNIFNFTRPHGEKGCSIQLKEPVFGVSQSGYLLDRRVSIKTPVSVSDVALAYNLASRGLVIDLKEFSAKMKAKRKQAKTLK